MTSPVSLPAGHAVVAADMDAYENLTAVWTDYSGSLAWTAASVNPALGNGTKTARYIQTGKLVLYAGVITMGSTTTFGTGLWSISLPVTSNGTLGVATGVVMVYDSSSATGHRPGAVRHNSTTKVDIMSTTGNVDATNPITWATSDNLRWFITYEAA
jgi:hypothetical protein